MLEGVISSKTKVNILVKLFLNPAMKAYLRELASEFEVSTNSVRTELNNLTRHKVLVSERDGRNVYYRANTAHPLFPELSSVVRKITGIDRLVNSVIERLGNLQEAYLTGDYAQGKDTGVMDIILIGNINRVQLDDIIRKTERYLDRKIRPLVLSRKELARLRRQGGLRSVMKLWDSKTHAG
jgi:DNA-binding transcriptional ArsR family regulator